MASSSDFVQEKWFTVTELLKVPLAIKTKWWEIIRESYAEEKRFYHNLEHIKFMLDCMERFREKIKNVVEVTLAILFHDIVYDPKALDNEERSAQLFKKFCQDCFQESIEIPSPNVLYMIAMTIHHRTEEHDKENVFGSDDIHYLLDFDMAILGQPFEEYEKYYKNIRQEYIHVEESRYIQRRSEVLSNFLSSRKIFCTKEFYDLFEDTARVNINNEIEILRNHEL